MQKLEIKTRECKRGEDIPSCPTCSYHQSSVKPTTTDHTFLCKGCGNVWFIKQVGKTEIVEV